MKYLPAVALAAVALAPLPALARPFTPADMVNLNRLSAPVASADGRWLAYQLRTTDFDNNRGRNDLYLLDLKAKGATPRLIASAADKNETAPTFAPDGASLYYLSDASGDDQLWRVALAGGEPVK